MIKIIQGKPISSKYKDVLVLSAEFMHGDADLDTFENMVADIHNQEQLGLIKAVFDKYESLELRGVGTRKEIPKQVTIVVNGKTYADPPLVDEEDEGGYYPYENPDMELEHDMGIFSDLSTMFPWDKIQADIDMYENRARLEKYSLTYYDAKGNGYEVTLDED